MRRARGRKDPLAPLDESAVVSRALFETMNTVSSGHHLPSSEPLAGKRVVFVCAGEPWSIGKDVGAPSFYETLKGYCEAGAEVHFLTHNKSGVNNDAHAHAVEVELPGLVTHRFPLPTSERRRVGKGCVMPCRSRWSPYH